MKIHSRWINWCIAASVYVTCRAIFRTLRIHYLTPAPKTNPYLCDGSEGFIFPVWHHAIAFPMFAGRHRRTVALVSKHRGGTRLGYGLSMLGIDMVRGSSGQHGAAAVREMLRVSANSHFVLTPDGPRGPRQQIKAGVIFLAARSGRAIVPTGFAATRFWKFAGKWTDLIIPKPFSTVYALGGQPISIPPHASREDLHHYRDLVQSEMDRLTDLAEKLARKDCPTAEEWASLMPQSTTDNLAKVA